MTWDYYLAGGALRASQIIIDASVWIAFGCMISAVLRRMVGPEKTRMIFGEGTRYGIVIGWAMGMLLPVCSLGTIPVVRQLHRSGIRGGTIIAFGLTAPLFNPLSVLYGLTLSDPIAIIIFTFCALVIVSVLGSVWNKWFSDATAEPEPDPIPSGGLKRSLAVLYSACYDFAGWSCVLIAIGVVASALTASLTAYGSLQTEAEPDKVFAPVFMAFFVSPIYATPLQAMSQIGGMFQHGNSVGAAFSLLILGAGTNLGLLLTFAGSLGVRHMVLFVGALLTITIGLAYCVDKPLYPAGVSPSGHTHAFDVYTHPYRDSETGYLTKAREDISEYRQANEFGATRLLLVLLIGGLIARGVSRRVDVEAWFRATSPKQSSALEVVVPSWVLGLVTCTGLVAISVVGTYLYYPPVNQLLSQLSPVNTECVLAAKTGDYEAVDKWVVYCDDLSRRLEVGVFLRTGGASDFQSLKARIYREKLDTLRDSIADGRTASIDELAMDVSKAYLNMSAAFREVEIKPTVLDSPAND